LKTAPVSAFLAWTGAFGNGSPTGFETTPLRVPEPLCPKAAVAKDIRQKLKVRIRIVYPFGKPDGSQRPDVGWGPDFGQYINRTGPGQ
jgi:hypothetical protein